MDISRIGKDLLENIDEVLSTEYECYKMLIVFDKGNGAEGYTANEIIKVIGMGTKPSEFFRQQLHPRMGSFEVSRQPVEF